MLAGAALIAMSSMIKATSIIALGFLGIALARRWGATLPSLRSIPIRQWWSATKDSVLALARSASLMGVIAIVVIVGICVGTGLGFGWTRTLSTGDIVRSWMSMPTLLSVGAGRTGIGLGLGDHTQAILDIVRPLAQLIAAAFILRWLLAALSGRIHPIGALGISMATIVVFSPFAQAWYLLWAVIPLAGLFGFIDLSFFGANLLKFFHGGWFPLAVAIVLFTVFMSWAAGLRLLRARMAAETLDVAELEGYVAAHHVPVIPGTAIFLTGGSKLPMALGEYLRKGGNLRANTVQAAFLVQQVPTVPLDEQLRFVELGPHLTRLEVRYGFMEYPSGKALIAALRAHGIPVAEGNSMIIIHTVDPLPVDSKGMALWRKHIFAFLMRNARQPQLVLTVPQDMIMEWTTLMRF